MVFLRTLKACPDSEYCYLELVFIQVAGRVLNEANRYGNQYDSSHGSQLVARKSGESPTVSADGSGEESTARRSPHRDGFGYGLAFESNRASAPRGVSPYRTSKVPRSSDGSRGTRVGNGLLCRFLRCASNSRCSNGPICIHSAVDALNGHRDFQNRIDEMGGFVLTRTN